MNEKIKGVCKHCGQEFEQKRGSGYRPQSYCSDECRVEYHRQQIHLRRLAAHEQKPEKNCPNCGRRFREEFGRGHRQKFCSPKCKQQYHNRTIYDAEHVRMREADPTCPHCARQFQYSKEHGGRRQKYCCDDCRKAYWREHQHLIEHKAVSRAVCQHCGREFEVCGSQPQKYCSRECYGDHLDSLQEIVTCLVCGRMFLASKKQRRKFCGQACMAAARTRLAIERWEDVLPARVELLEPGPLPVELKPVELDEPLWILPGAKRPKRIILVCKPLDFWNSWIDFLCNHIQNELGMNPLAGDVFVFCNSKRTEIRMLQWNEIGFELLSKKLGYGHFPWPKTEDNMREISETDFRLLLEYPKFMMRMTERRIPKKFVV